MSDAAVQRDLPAVRDFPDRLPPMVVKELRQGLRARLFGETVAGFHLVLVAVLLPALSFGESSEVTDIQRLLWWIFTGVLVLLLPLRGLSALIQERRENTLDTLLLTNLSAGRIVWGKWLAVASQIAVTGASLVPYAIMMYAAGGISLADSLAALLRLGLLGLLLTACYTALSWNASWLWRAGPALVLSVLAVGWYAGPLARSLGSGNGYFPELSPVHLLAEVLAAGSLIFLVLEMASARLAPWSEDHRTGPRLLGLALPVCAALGSGHALWGPVMGGTALAALTLISLSALTEPWPALGGGGAPGRSWRLPSGWPHGIFWALAAWGLMALTARQWLSGWSDSVMRLAAWLFAGRLLLFLFPASRRHSAVALLATALVFFLVQTALSLGGELLNFPALAKIAGAVPGPFPVPGPAGAGRDQSTMAAASAACCALVAVAAWWRHRSARKEAVL